MDLWQKARSFAEEAAKRSQDLNISSSKISDFVSEASKRSKEIAAEASKRAEEITLEASKRSKEIAAEASKRAEQFKAEALKRAEEIKRSAALSSVGDAEAEAEVVDLEKFGVTDELREFVKEITLNTFEDFPLEDDSEMSNIPTVSNVRQDLTEWQERHAKLVLSTVKEISKLRYQLCPRVMKERKFWRIYFILVNSHVTPYEKRYMEEAKLKKSDDQVKEDTVKEETSTVGTTSKTEVKGVDQKKKPTEQDLDVFLLGDAGDSDEGPDDGNDGFDDDFDKI